jgi:hypothetical protein
MSLKIRFYIALVLLSFQISYGQEKVSYLYQDAFKELKGMLNDSIKPDFKRAVFITENAYYDGNLDYDAFNELITIYSNIIKAYIQANPLPYKGSDYNNMIKNYAIAQFMMDTIWLDKDTALHYPYRYDFEDFACEKDWSGMFVSKLLRTNKGNCHSMPFLYKILADEIGAEAFLSLAPYHMYIKTRSEKTGWYNTELTNGSFPVDAWVSASGYVSLDAMRSGIYMDTLSLKQSIAFCLYDLAKGCERKYGFQQFPFIFDCLNLALDYYPNFINANLYKVDCLKKRFNLYLKLYNTKDHKDILKYETPNQIFQEMEGLYAKILNLGFRQMPPAMYHEWLMSLKNNKEKYQNKELLFNLHPN